MGHYMMVMEIFVCGVVATILGAAILSMSLERIVKPCEACAKRVETTGRLDD